MADDEVSNPAVLPFTRDEQLKIGEYYKLYSNYAVTFVLVAATLYAIPFLVGKTSTWDRIAIAFTTQAGQKFHLGIYKDDGDINPGALVVDAGEVTLASTGVKASVISEQLDPGWYWLAVLSDGTPTSRANRYAWSPAGMTVTTLSSVNAHLAVAQAFGALPDPFTGGGSWNPETGISIALRLASYP